VTPPVSLFPFAEYWWFYVGFTAFVCVLLALDLGVFHRKAHEVSFKEAATWSVVWVALALLFCFGFYHYMIHAFANEPRFANIAGFDPARMARQGALEFLAGYVVEYSLSVDNIFVFVVVLGYFCVPLRLQHRVLFFGILGALVFRATFIALGAALLRFTVVIWLFGAFLVVTGIRMLFTDDKPVQPEENAIIRLFRRFVPVSPRMVGHRFFVVVDGSRQATPLFIALLFLG
jgi:tellurite resistance protein TerC